MFTNMPWSEECAEMINPYLDKISLGIDLNITTGRPVLSEKEISGIVRKDGYFLTSNELRMYNLENKMFDELVWDEIYREFEAQIIKFIKINGQIPDYIHAHAYTPEVIKNIQRDLAKKYNVPYSFDLWEALENQIKTSLESFILDNSDNLLNMKFCILVGHMGYVDKELMDLSTYSLYRINDLHASVSPKIIQWVENNQVELITYRYFKNTKVINDK